MTTLNILMLGPPQITWDETPVVITRRATRTLLFYLASMLKPVGRSLLCESFWPDISERDARSNLRSLLSKLKRSLPDPDLLQTQDDLVWLNQAGLYVDLHVFNQDVHKLKDIPWQYPNDSVLPKAVLDSMEALIALWHGDHFLQDARLISNRGIDAWLMDTNNWLNSSRTMHLERLAAHYMLSGDVMMAVQYGRTIMAYDEGNSKIHQKIIQTLVRGGYINEAQTTLDFSRNIFQNHLGLELPEEIKQAQEMLEAVQNPNFPLSIPRYPQDFSMNLKLVGRQHELGLLQKAFDSGGVLLLKGESGSGKSRLVKEFFERTWPNSRLLLAACNESNQNTPMQAMIDMMRSCITEDEWKALPNLWANFLTLLLPDLTLWKPNLVIPERPTGNMGEGMVFEALLNLFTLAAEKNRILFVLDDAQWADVSTLTAINHLILHGFFKKYGLLLIIYQSDEAIAGLQKILNLLRKTASLEELSLNNLDPHEVFQLVSQMLSKPPELEFVDNLYQITGGNPYIVLETMKTLIDSASFEDELSIDNPLPIPKNVQNAVTRKLLKLDTQSLACLQAAAILGPTFERNVLSTMVEQPSALLTGSLRQLVFFDIIKPEHSAMGDNLMRFAQTIEQRTIYTNLSPVIRASLHIKAAQALQSVFHGQVESLAARIARHYQSAEMYHEALHWWIRAEVYAYEMYSREVALQALKEVENIIKKNPLIISDDDAYEFFSHKALLAYETDDSPLLKHTCEECLELGRKRKSHLLIGAAYHYLSFWCFRQYDYTSALTNLEKAITYLSVTDKPLLLAEAYIRKGSTFANFQNFSAAIADYDRADELLKNIHDPAVLELSFQAKAQKSLSLLNVGRYNEAFYEVDEAFAKYKDVLRPFNQIRAHLAYCYSLFNLAKYDQAQEHIENGLEVVSSLGNITFELYFKTYLARIELRKGHLDSCHAIVSELISKSEFIRHPDLFMHANGVMAELYTFLLNFSQAEEYCRIATRNPLKNNHYGIIQNRLAYCLSNQAKVTESEAIIAEILQNAHKSDLGSIHDEALINQAYNNLIQGESEKAYMVFSKMIEKCTAYGRNEMTILLKTMRLKAAGELGYENEVDTLQQELCNWSQQNNLPWVHLNVVPIWLKYTHKDNILKEEMTSRSKQLLEQIEPFAQSELIRESFLAAKQYWSDF